MGRDRCARALAACLLVLATGALIGCGKDRQAAPELRVAAAADLTRAFTEIAAAYHERWEIELAFDEIETHQRGPAAVLRSRTPDMVLQELYGLLVTHYAIRKLMAEAADQAELDPDRLSFTRALNLVRRQVTAQAGLSPLTTGPRDG